MNKRLNRNLTSKVFLQIMLALIGVLTLAPFFIMINMGTYRTFDMYKQIPIFPGDYLIENFKSVIRVNFIVFYKNSIVVTTSAIILTVFFSALAGYGFAKYRFKGEKALFLFLIATMMIPHQTGLVAFVWQMTKLGLAQTHLPLILPWISNAFGVFWMTQYIRSAVPNEIIESARIDGSHEFRTFIGIVFPVIKPALASLAILCFVWSWNSFLLPMVLYSKTSLYTVPVGISVFGMMYYADYAAQILALSISLIPVLIIFILGSKRFISGLTAGSVKG